MTQLFGISWEHCLAPWAYLAPQDGHLSKGFYAALKTVRIYAAPDVGAFLILNNFIVFAPSIEIYLQYLRNIIYFVRVPSKSEFSLMPFENLISYVDAIVLTKIHLGKCLF